MTIQQNKRNDWKERQLINGLYLEQVSIRVGNHLEEEDKIGRGVRQGCWLSPILFTINHEEIIGKSLGSMAGVSFVVLRIIRIRFASQDTHRTASEVGQRMHRFRNENYYIYDGWQGKKNCQLNRNEK